jgi:RNA polymerase sigma-70 factor (ECF subfamily)
MTLKNLHFEEEPFAFFQKGKEQGLSYFFKAYRPALIVFARGIVKQREVAQDIVQDSLIKLWRKRPKIRDIASLRNYFYRTVHNKCINFLRIQNRRLEIWKTLNTETKEPSFFQGIIRLETLRHLYAAIKRLPPQCAGIVHMYYEVCKHYKTIANEWISPSIPFEIKEKGRRNTKKENLMVMN